MTDSTKKDFTTKDPTSLIRDNIRGLAPYSTARDEYDGPLGIYLDANENPYENGYNRYPDPHQRGLKCQISAIKGVPAENIFIGNGSDEAIDLVFRVFCEPGRDNVVAIRPTYGMYKVAAAINNIEYREVDLLDDFSVDFVSLKAASDMNTKAFFLCSPNNPTANLLDKKGICRLLDEAEAMVIVDEAYIDFAGDEGFLPLLGNYPNLLVMQTMSKARGMAGLRFGMAFAAKEVIYYFNKVKYPYNINCVTQQIVSEQLKSCIDEQVAELISQRRILEQELSSIPLIRKVYPSDANFILVKVDQPKEVYNRLIGEGVIVRDRSGVKGCQGCLRLTVGTPQENETLLRILKDMDTKQNVES